MKWAIRLGRWKDMRTFTTIHFLHLIPGALDGQSATASEHVLLYLAPRH